MKENFGLYGSLQGSRAFLSPLSSQVTRMFSQAGGLGWGLSPYRRICPQIKSIRAHNLEIIPSLRSLFSVYPSLGLIDDLPSIRKPLHFKTLGKTLGREGHSPWGLIAGAECFLFETAGLLLTNKPFTWGLDWRSNSWGVGGCMCTPGIQVLAHTESSHLCPPDFSDHSQKALLPPLP